MATIFYIIDGRRLELECELHERPAAIADIRRQGLAVVGWLERGTGRQMKEARR